MKTVHERCDKALREDPKLRRKVEQARRQFLKGLQLIAQATDSVGIAMQSRVTGLGGNLMVVTADTEYEFTIDGFMHLELWKDRKGKVSGMSMTLASSDTEDGEEPYYVKAGFSCEADYFAAQHSKEH
jgi:hypothetical protein